jgi:hypothetical protein
MKCYFCGKEPRDLPEYVKAGRVNNMTPDEFVLAEEGTLNTETGEFACTPCYIAAGQPVGPTRGVKWHAGDPIAKLQTPTGAADFTAIAEDLGVIKRG